MWTDFRSQIVHIGHAGGYSAGNAFAPLMNRSDETSPSELSHSRTPGPSNVLRSASITTNISEPYCHHTYTQEPDRKSSKLYHHIHPLPTLTSGATWRHLHAAMSCSRSRDHREGCETSYGVAETFRHILIVEAFRMLYVSKLLVVPVKPRHTRLLRYCVVRRRSWTSFKGRNRS